MQKRKCMLASILGFSLVTLLSWFAYSSNGITLKLSPVFRFPFRYVNPTVTDALINGTDVLVVGSDLTGAVLAYLHATVMNQTVLVVEKRDHVGGYCYDYIDESNIRISKYGLHTFHTNDKKTWDFISQFTEWLPYQSRLMGFIAGKYVTLPPNIDTVNLITGSNISTVDEMKQWINRNWATSQEVPKGNTSRTENEQKNIFKTLCEPFSRNYFPFNEKVGDKMGDRRLFVRDNFDTRLYPQAKFQGIPRDGCTTLINKLLAHPKIKVVLNTEFSENRRSLLRKNFNITYYTERIDRYFQNEGMQELEYTSVKFEKSIIQNNRFYQPAPVIYYYNGQNNISKITDYIHFTNVGERNFTVIVREKISPDGTPLFPVRDSKNSQLYEKYRRLRETEEKKRNIRFVGGLTTYEYIDMATSVTRAIVAFERLFKSGITLPQKTEKRSKLASLSLLVSHCQKSLTWIKSDFVKECSKRKMNIFIYEKCGRLEEGQDIKRSYPACDVHQIILPNVGREGHSWLHHMFTQALYFHDINIFVQGGKETNTNNIRKHIARYDRLPLVREENNFNSSLLSLMDTYTPLSGSECADKWKFGAKSDAIICKWYKKLTGTDKKCSRFVAFYRGEMILSEALLRRTLSKYTNFLLDLYHVLSESNNPPEGHVLERLWKVIFHWPHVQYC